MSYLLLMPKLYLLLHELILAHLKAKVFGEKHFIVGVYGKHFFDIRCSASL